MSDSSETMQMVAELLTCPVTGRLPVRPLAMEGQVYEGSSASVRRRLGGTSLTSSSALSGVVRLVALHREDAVWHAASARVCLVEDNWDLAARDIESARRFLEQDAERWCNPESRRTINSNEIAEPPILLSELELLTELLDWLRTGRCLVTRLRGRSAERDEAAALDTTSWLVEVAEAARRVVLSRTGHPHVETHNWQLAPGQLVRVVADEEELQYLCSRPAPGAVSAVQWVPRLAAFAGLVCEVESSGTETHRNVCVRNERTSSKASLPYDALLPLHATETTEEPPTQVE